MSRRPVPKGNQHKVIFLSENQHHVVLGTAGTGKSTMAILRAERLSRATTPNNGPVLVVTFNSALATYLRFLAAESARNITIVTYGKFARGYLNSVGRMGYNQIAGPGDVNHDVAQAVITAQQAGHSSTVLRRNLEWIVDEIHWISGMGITTVADYQAVGRVGRQTPLARGAARDAVWAVRENYIAVRSSRGFLYDWHDIATVVHQCLVADDRPRRYKHIIIDEGQDFSPEMIRSLVAAASPNGSLTFFGDYHQAIYGQGLSWRKSGISLRGRPVERFADNLRNTAQIANVALAIAKLPFMAGEADDLVVPRSPKAVGPMPVLAQARDAAAEATYLRGIARAARHDQSVAILARTWAEAKQVAGDLDYTKLRDSMPHWDEKPGIYIGAYHSAKGLEFDTVLLPFLGAETLPHPDVLHAFDESEAYSREARLLYVAITRARTSLVMSYSQRITPLLPANNGLWTEESV